MTTEREWLGPDVADLAKLSTPDLIERLLDLLRSPPVMTADEEAETIRNIRAYAQPPWTSDPPTEPGWWWVKRPEDAKPVAREVKMQPYDKEVSVYLPHQDKLLDGNCPVSGITAALWSGPIAPRPLPEDDP